MWDGRTGRLLASLDGHTDAVLDAAFSADGNRVITASADGKIKLWDVQLEDRTPDSIRRIVRSSDPWLLANGVLVPAPDASTNDWDDSDEQGTTPPGDGGVAPMLFLPGEVTSNEDYAAKLAALTAQLGDLFDEIDCDKLAAKIRAFTDANKAQMAALVTWSKAHTVDDSTLDKTMSPVTKKLMTHLPVFEKCKRNQAFTTAMRAASLQGRR